MTTSIDPNGFPEEQTKDECAEQKTQISSVLDDFEAMFPFADEKLFQRIKKNRELEKLVESEPDKPIVFKVNRSCKNDSLK